MNLKDLMIKYFLRDILDPDQQLLQKRFNRIDLPLNDDIIDEVTVFLPLFASLVDLDDVTDFL